MYRWWFLFPNGTATFWSAVIWIRTPTCVWCPLCQGCIKHPPCVYNYGLTRSVSEPMQHSFLATLSGQLQLPQKSHQGHWKQFIGVSKLTPWTSAQHHHKYQQLQSLSWVLCCHHTRGSVEVAQIWSTLGPISCYSFCFLELSWSYSRSTS
jgi:hypothetical protein